MSIPAIGSIQATPPHQWTHDGEHVLILKCVNADMTSHNGFVWPQSGPVRPDTWSRNPDCESGGLFGWPWGLSFGDGKQPQYDGKWIIFRAHPADVILVGGKCKAVPNDDKGRCPEVVYCGDYAGALAGVLPGQIAWVQHAASGAASATGMRGAASATGWRGAASATGERGAASATGARGAASATGEYATVEVGVTGLACVTADHFKWKYHSGAVICQRCGDDVFLLRATDVEAEDGDMLKVQLGQIVPQWD